MQELLCGARRRRQKTRHRASLEARQKLQGKGKAVCTAAAELVVDNKRNGTRGEHPRPRPPQPRDAASEPSNLKPDYKEPSEDLARLQRSFCRPVEKVHFLQSHDLQGHKFIR